MHMIPELSINIQINHLYSCGLKAPSLSGTSLFITEDRHEVIEFIKTFNLYGTKFILKKPSVSFVKNIFLMIFTKEVWISSLIILIIFGVVLYGLLNWEMSTKNIQVSKFLNDGVVNSSSNHHISEEYFAVAL